MESPGALEAELSAGEDGLKLALHWAPLPIQVETDYAKILKFLELDSKGRSRNMFQVAAVSEMLHERSMQVTKIGRSQNKAAHAMAAMGRGQQRTACWLANSPQEISIVISNECTVFCGCK